MSQSLTITLPAEVQQALDAYSQREGVSAEDVVNVAVKHHLFLRQFRSLRERMIAKNESIGKLTDEDVFNRVS
jgi:hypothetical protein